MSINYEVDENKLMLPLTLPFDDSDDFSFINKRNHLGISGFTPTCINLLKSILGTGLLALPLTFQTLGPFLAIPLLFLFAYFSTVGLRIYSLCGMRAGVDSLGLVCRMVDWRLQMIVDVALVIMCIGTAVSYLSLIGDMIPVLLNSFTNLRVDRIICVILSVLILLPLSFIRNSKHLRYTSILGLIGIVFLVYLSIHLLIKKGISKDPSPLFNLSFDGLKQLNVIVFVFTCHQNLLHIKYDAKDQSESFINLVIRTCIIISGVMYLLFSMASCLVFGSEIKSNILNNYSDGVLTTLAKWLYVMMAIFSFPLMIAPAKSAVINLCPFDLDQSTATVIVVFSSVILSIFITDLSTISAWIGVLAGVPICYLLPGFLYHRYFTNDTTKDKNWKQNIIASIAMFTVGIFLIITFILM